MRNRNATQPPDVSTVDPLRSSKHAVLARVFHTLGAAIDWLRAGYPDEAPRTGYSPLLALNGPLALTPKQKDRIATELEYPANTTSIDVAISKVTNCLPTPPQTRAIRHRFSQQ